MNVNTIRAIFLDRDGTINEDVGDLYCAERLRFIPGAIDALRMLQECFMLFIITNQSGIGKGIFSEQEYNKFTDYFNNFLTVKGVNVREILHCPHVRGNGCGCHKPSTYFINRLVKQYSIDVASSFCIGDHPHDIAMAELSGTKSIYLLTGHGLKHREELTSKPDYVAHNLYDAATWILSSKQEIG